MTADSWYVALDEDALDTLDLTDTLDHGRVFAVNFSPGGGWRYRVVLCDLGAAGVVVSWVNEGRSGMYGRAVLLARLDQLDPQKSMFANDANGKGVLSDAGLHIADRWEEAGVLERHAYKLARLVEAWVRARLAALAAQGA